MNKIIAHLDLDAFFASVEELDNPQFKGRPIVVGADPHSPAGEGTGRGVVSTANYKAREYGIGSAMPVQKAWKLSEAARKRGEEPCVFLPPNGARYGEVSEQVFNIVQKYTDKIQQVSIDEAYFEITSKNIAKKIKKEIKETLKITASIGAAPNKLIAKIASDYQKPDGLTVVLPEQAQEFLEQFNVEKLPGVGPKTKNALNKQGIKTIEDLKEFSAEDLAGMFGARGEDLYRKALGYGSTEIVSKREAKSIGAEHTFEADTSDAIYLTEQLNHIANKVWERFNKSNFKAFKTVTIVVRFSNFKTQNRSKTMANAAREVKTIKTEALKLFLPFLDKRENPQNLPIRLVGIRVEKLC